MKDSGIIIEIKELDLDEKHELSRFFEGLGEGYNKRISNKEEGLLEEKSISNLAKSNKTSQEPLDLDKKYHINMPKTRTRKR